jgi:predicted porin
LIASDDVSSYIFSASIVPLPEKLTLFGGFISEPGTGDRNNTVNVGFNMAIGEFRLDGEYMKALDREKYTGFNSEFKESVLSLGVAYEFEMRKREVIGGALFAERKAHLVTEPLEIAARYEHFDDDDMVSVSQTWSVEDRYSVGVRYAFYNNPESGLTAYIGTEYRHTGYRLHASQRATREDDNDELFIRVGVSF